MVQNLQLSSHTHWQNTVQVRFTPDSFQRNQLIWREMSSYHPTFQVKRCAKHERETTARICWKQHLLKKISSHKLRAAEQSIYFASSVWCLRPTLCWWSIKHSPVLGHEKRSSSPCFRAFEKLWVIEKTYGAGKHIVGLWKKWSESTNERCGRVPEGQHIGQSKGVSKRWKNPWSLEAPCYFKLMLVSQDVPKYWRHQPHQLDTAVGLWAVPNQSGCGSEPRLPKRCSWPMTPPQPDDFFHYWSWRSGGNKYS